MFLWFKYISITLRFASILIIIINVANSQEYTPETVLDFMNNDYQTKHKAHFANTFPPSWGLFGSNSNDRNKVMKEISYGTPIRVSPIFEITNNVLKNNQEDIDGFITRTAQLKQLRYQDSLKELQADGSKNDYVTRMTDNKRITRKQMEDDFYLKGDLELLKQEALQQLIVPFQTYYNYHFIIPVFYKKKFTGYQFFNPHQSDDYYKTRNYEDISARRTWSYLPLPLYPFRVDEEKAMEIAMQSEEPILINIANLRKSPDYGRLYWFFSSSQTFVSTKTGALYKLVDDNGNDIKLENIDVQLNAGTNFAQFYSSASLTNIQTALYTKAPLKDIFLEHKHIITSWILMPIGIVISIYEVRKRKRKRRELRF